MTCREVIEFLMLYLDGELPEGERLAFEHHLHGCPPCMSYLETYKETIRLGKDAFADKDAVCEEIPDELVRAILAARKKPE